MRHSTRRQLLAENGFRGVDDAHGRILPAIGAELLGVLDEHVGVDDRLVGITLVPAVHPGQHHLDRVVAAFDKLLAGHGREIENDGMRRRGRLAYDACDFRKTAPASLPPIWRKQNPRASTGHIESG